MRKTRAKGAETFSLKRTEVVKKLNASLHKPEWQSPQNGVYYPVWAAGDVSNYPDKKVFEKRRRLEHWDHAVEQGRCAVRNMMGKPQPFIHVPYFFSDLFDLSYEFWGDAEGPDDVVYRGKMDSGKFSVWWFRRERLVAAFVMSRPEEERELAPKWIIERTKINRKALRDSKRGLCSI